MVHRERAESGMLNCMLILIKFVRFGADADEAPLHLWLQLNTKTEPPIQQAKVFIDAQVAVPVLTLIANTF